MEPVWEYRWAFVEKGHWGGRKETNFHMTDPDAERWWAARSAIRRSTLTSLSFRSR
jgi:hypothetical protein